MKIQKAQIECNDKKINILLQIPDKENPPVVIMVHGYGGEGLEKYFVDTGKELAKNGFFVVNFLFSAYNNINDISNLSIEDSIEELKCIIGFVNKQNIDKNRIAIVAQSLGCSITILLNDERIKANVFLAPGIFLRKVFSKLFKHFNVLEELENKGFAIYKPISRGTDKKIGVKFWNEVKQIDHITEEQIRKIKIPTLIVHGTDDDLVEIEQSKKLYEMLNEPKKLFLVKDAPHVTINNLNQRKIVIKEILDWLNKWLK
ncbi:MAG: alpha/beta hydrolase [Candidatus Aenigmarchaeota archaeon]|nr:alpha/beta hydrolase [Candidatus Aenigmarchaeota archaeon]